jgi:CubicO group peptidase (beta-lactamase class C family)
MLAIFSGTSMCAQVNEEQAAIDTILKNDFSGVILVAQDGIPEYFEANGFRKFEKRKVLHKADIFEMASVSKQFTAMIIMMLQEKGKLQYDDDISKHVSVPYNGITIRHLLTHTSGLPDYQKIMDKHWDKSKVAGNPEIIEYLNKLNPRIFVFFHEK